MTDSKRKAPAFQFYADDFISGTITMTNEERGAYIALLCIQWSKGFVNETDFNRIGAGMPSHSQAICREKFWVNEKGEFRNARLEAERQKQRAYSEKQSAIAKLRWVGNANAMPQHMPETCFPSPSPSTTKEYVPSEVEIEKEETKREANTILETLNEVSGRKFRLTDTNLGLIQARLKEPGVDLEGMLKMVRRQAAIWMPDPKMSEYVRPETLFGKKKFDSYYGSRELPIPKNQQQQETQTYPKGYEWMADKRDWRHAL